MDEPLLEQDKHAVKVVATGILYYPPGRNLRYPIRSWCTPEQPIWTKTYRPILAVSDVRRALRGLDFVPRDIDYDLEFLRDGEWIPEKTAADYDVMAYMRATCDVIAAAHALAIARHTLTVRLKFYGSCSTVRDQDGPGSHESYYNDRELHCVIS